MYNLPITNSFTAAFWLAEWVWWQPMSMRHKSKWPIIREKQNLCLNGAPGQSGDRRITNTKCRKLQKQNMRRHINNMYACVGVCMSSFFIYIVYCVYIFLLLSWSLSVNLTTSIFNQLYLSLLFCSTTVVFLFINRLCRLTVSFQTITWPWHVLFLPSLSALALAHYL